jgi:hypothetical protein
MERVNSRLVLHFPGYENLDARAHYQRYQRAAAMAGDVYAAEFQIGPLASGTDGDAYIVDGRGDDWAVRSKIQVFDYSGLITSAQTQPVWRQIVSGYRAAFSIISEGAAWRYFRNAWRFGLFFVFPFLFMAVFGGLAAGIAAMPLLLGLNPFLLLVSVPFAALFFAYVAMPVSRRFHVLHLFADWRFALAVARDEPALRAWIDKKAEEVLATLEEPFDEVLITSHSMGASLALQVIGRVLEMRSDAFDGKNVAFVTLGGAALQCAFLSSASVLRRRIGDIARHPGIAWMDIQCLTDPIHLYRCSTVALSGITDAVEPRLVFIRFKHALTPERYRKHRRNFLRMHRQYVLGPDRKSAFDFTLMTAGPRPAISFADA